MLRDWQRLAKALQNLTHEEFHKDFERALPRMLEEIGNEY